MLYIKEPDLVYKPFN